MKTLVRRIFLLFLCLALPCAAMAESAADGEPVIHADFTLGLGLHADGFPPVDAHPRDWEAFLSKLTLSGSLDGTRFFQPDSRLYMEAAICVNGEVTVPFTYDGKGSYRYLVSPALCGDSVLFQAHNYLEFMLKPFYYLGLPTNYIAVLTYPNATVYLADSFYAPVKEMMDEAHAAAMEAAGGENPETLSYVITFERLLTLCGELNAVTTGDTSLQRVKRYMDALLAELYISETVVEGLKQTELMLYMLDPQARGMAVTETAGGMTCALGDTVVFKKTIAGAVTEISSQLPIAEESMISLSCRSADTGDAMDVSASVSVTEGGNTLLSLSLEGEGLPTEGALGGEGRVTVGFGGSELTEEPASQTFAFRWSRTSAELPCELSLTVDFLHPETGLPAASVYVSAALDASDASAFPDQLYDRQDFFGLNPVLLEEYKERWGLTIGAYLLPVALEMPIGVIDDVVNFMLETDILISLVE
ncbi:MAG: hypothetical protein JW811_02600 [Clostridiales bacterium]|nr:hypothetical protein [Clostridiales bacterium]